MKGRQHHEYEFEMTDNRVLENECANFARYLADAVPTAQVTAHYVKATSAHGLAFDREFSAFDRTMLRIARRNRLLTRFADAYSAILNRRGVLRRKLVLLAAILEHVPPTSEVFDQSLANGAGGALIRLVSRSIEFAFSFIVGVIIFLPLRLVRRGRVDGASI